MSSRILYLATADARGHLMRAQILVHALRAANAEVEVLTTSEAGIDFLAEFGVQAQLLSPHYAVQFDAQQNMLRGATDRNVAHYVFRPGRMLKDIGKLSRMLRRFDLVINDSFHPALLCMGALPGWRHKVVHVYGGSLRAALLSNFEGRLPKIVAQAFSAIVSLQIRRARCSIEHDFACDVQELLAPSRYRLPTPVAVAQRQTFCESQGDLAAIYLNPHFQNTALADALCAGLADEKLRLHCVGEGLAGHDAWQGVDNDWVSQAARAQLMVSAPGMAALSVARIYRRPILLVLTDQPEQARNAENAARLQVAHEVVVWRGDADDFREQVAVQARKLLAAVDDSDTETRLAQCREHAQTRIVAWVRCLQGLKR